MSDDVHAHRRHNDDDDVTGYRLQAATESTIAKAVARFGVPLLLAALSVLGGLAFNDIKTDIQSEIASSASDRRQTGQDIAQIKSDVRDLNTRLDAQVIRQVDQNTRRMESFEARIQTLERSVRTP